MYSRRTIAGLVAMILLAGLVAAEAVRSATEKTPQSREEIVKAQLKLIREAQELYKLRLEQPPRPGEAPTMSGVFPEMLIVWSRREVDARSEFGGTADRIAALEAHRNTMKLLVNRLERLYQTGAISREVVLDAKYELLQAELWLAKTRASD
jgi:hypothetical protein